MDKDRSVKSEESDGGARTVAEDAMATASEAAASASDMARNAGASLACG
ncbi:hypothetical protein ACFQU2_08115 [Siccirubricoccus deserti]